MAIIAELETIPRRIYTGAIGFIGPGRQSCFNVAIRTALIDRDTRTAEYGVGGGIVWDSDSREEYEECWTKARVLTAEQPEFELLETLLWTPSEGFFLLDRHLDRLCASAGYFDIPVARADVEAALRNWTATAPSGMQRVRLLATRSGAVAVQAQRFDVASDAPPVRLRLAPGPIDPGNRFLYHKTTHRRVYEEARAAVGDADDVLLWNPDGELTETSIANLAVELGGERITPPVQCGLLPGTFRAALLAEGAIHEGIVRRSDLPRCRKLWLINSVRKWRPAVLLEG
jgi:para-aminobenzoate synthetase/4-amino-4-deoxychorismate lyase